MSKISSACKPPIQTGSRSDPGRGLDLSARVLSDPDGRPVSLTNAEFLLLTALVEAPRRVLSREQLLERTH